jgi:ABC-2 type transport system ATP-binding protein
VSDGTPAELEGQAPTHNTVLITVCGVEPAMAHERFMTVNGVKKVEDQGKDGDLVRLRIYPDDGQWILPDVGQYARDQGWDVQELYQDRGQLDDVFRLLTTPKQALS